MSEHAADHHITPPSRLAINLVCLAVLMVLTIAAAQVNIGQIVFGDGKGESVLNNVVAMTIAIIKAALVVQIFMGVKWATQLTKMWAYFGFLWLATLLITLGDYTSRYWEINRGWYVESKDTSALPSEVDQRKVEELKEERAKEAASGGEAH